jgi:predicted RND superfamily exporter protein
VLSLFSKYYYGLVLRRPGIALLLIALVVVFFGYHTASFRLDASADALVLENDEALDYYRSIRARYGSDDYLIITYTPNDDLFSDAVLQELRTLRDKLRAMDRVESVVSLLDVPLIKSPPVSIDDLKQEVPTLESPQTNRNMARQEFLSSPLYRNLIISPDGKTTALQLSFRRDETWHRLMQQRSHLREKRLHSELSGKEREQLASISQQFDSYSTRLQEQQSRDIAEVRSIMDQHREKAELYLGGVPMIASDSIDFIRHDLMTFGIGVLCFLILILTVLFRKPRWVILPMLTCFAAGVITVGFLGLVDWPVTVVSSNFISLLLIITLSLMIHLIVRYRELHEQSPDATQQTLVWETLRAKAMPCFYTTITTMVAFGSLLFSGIRPVIDFGWMMSIGVAVAFVLVFTLFPATLMFLKPGTAPNRNDLTNKITHFFVILNKAYSSYILMIFSALVIVSIAGISLLTVENRFIDYFKDTTEIYRGMELIDRELGGTIPLDVIVDAPAEFFAEEEEEWDSPFEDDFPPDMEKEAGITETSYWFNTYQIKQVSAVHQYLNSLPETGKVLSIDTAMKILSQFDKEVVSDDFLLALFYKKLPEEVKQTLLQPYMASDGNQIRFAVRVFETEPSLQRDVLLKKIRHELTSKMNLKEDQVHLSGMLVLYNNMLQSLFRSQILTIGVVFLAIMLMFAILFRNLKMAIIAIIPNLFAPALMLGLMGWLKIPLDMMTITIAAISIGIAVDDTIHYIHRLTSEFHKDHDYWAAVNRSHASIGHAMYYTTITITLGFSILALSNFIPSIYFGLLTGFAMLTALLAALTLLPLLIIRFKPLGKPLAATPLSEG